MKVIGLTGNIASGKSTAARLLTELGAAHLDADHVVHRLYQAGTIVSQAIAERFGPEMLAADGSVDRRALGALVFDDPQAMRALETLVHPYARIEIERLVDEARQQPDPPPALVLEAVKLIESGRHLITDSVWFVVAREAVQKQRLMEARGWSEAEAEARVASQAPISARLHHADVIIENSGTLETLERQVEDAWQQLFEEDEGAVDRASMVE